MSFDFKKFIAGFGHAFRGIGTAFQSEQNFRIHVLVALIAIILGIALEISRIEWLFIIVCIGLVFAAEIFNSSIEALCDLASPEIHPIAKKTKDMSAAAVLVCAICALIVGIAIFGLKIVNLVLQTIS